MKNFKYVVQDEVGLHARPAGLLVKEAGKAASAVTIECKGKTADAKRLLAVMGLGVKKGDEITITVDGADEAAVAASLEEFCKNNL
ncbi:MAG: HPr family phosphocarrier protein [Clostridiales bacterium]|nr:HPr family phosphocarrier protein [Clostridiales bacterium]